MFRYITVLIILFLYQYHLAAQKITDSQAKILSTIERLRTTDPDSAFSIIKKEYKNIPERSIYYADLIYQEGALQYIQSNYTLALTKFIELQQLSEEITYEKGKARAYNGRGLIFLGRNLYTEAIAELQKAANINQKIKERSTLAVNYFNIGICKDYLNQDEEAFKYLKRGLKIAQKENIIKVIDQIYNRMGMIFLKQEVYDSANHYFLKVINNNVNKWELSFAYSGIASLKLKQQKYDDALFAGFKAFKLAQELNAKWDIKEVSIKISEAYEKLNNYSAALTYYKLYHLYNDSILNEEKNREINWAELQQTKSENEQLEAQKELYIAKSNTNKWIIFSLITGLIFLFIVAFLYRRNIKYKEKYNRNLSKINQQLVTQKKEIQQKNQDLEILNNTKIQLFSILSHDLRSPINSIRQLLDIGDKIPEADKENFLKVLKKDMEIMNTHINTLLNWANTQMDGFETNPKMTSLKVITEEVSSSISKIATEKGVKIKIEISNIEVYVDPDHLKIILSNLLNNGLKYCKTGDQIKISDQNEADKIKLIVADTGIGMDEETLSQLKGNTDKRLLSKKGTLAEQGTGLGMLLVRQFLNYNNANIEIESTIDIGSIFTIIFPKHHQG